MKKAKNILTCIAVAWLLADAVILNSVLTADVFEWWMIPIGILTGGYLIGFMAVAIRKVKKHIW